MYLNLENGPLSDSCLFARIVIGKLLKACCSFGYARVSYLSFSFSINFTFILFVIFVIALNILLPLLGLLCYCAQPV